MADAHSLIEFLKSHGLTPQTVVLDYGCHALPLIRYLDAGRYIGVYRGWRKPAGGSIDQAKRPRLHRIRKGDLTDMFEPRSLDFILCWDAWTRLNPTGVVENILWLGSLLNDGGRMIAAFHDGESVQSGPRHWLSHTRVAHARYPAAVLKDFALRCGFDSESLGTVVGRSALCLTRSTFTYGAKPQRAIPDHAS